MKFVRPAAPIAVVTAVAVAVALGGCTAAVPASPRSTESSSTGATHTPTPVSTPQASTPAATRSTPPALSDLTLSTDGLSYVHVGKAVPTVPKPQRIVDWNTNVCGSVEPGMSGWESAPSVTRDDEGLPAFGVFARFGTTGRDEKTPIGLILVYSADIRTPHGLGVGSTIAEIKALGAKKISTDRFDDDGGYVFDPWVITGTGGELVFWIWQGTDKKAGYTVGRVSFELVQEKGTKPYFPYELDNCS